MANEHMNGDQLIMMRGMTFHAVLRYAWNVAVQKSFINRVYGGRLCHWVRHDPLSTLAASSILCGRHWDQVEELQAEAQESQEPSQGQQHQEAITVKHCCVAYVLFMVSPPIRNPSLPMGYVDSLRFNMTTRG